MTSTSRPAEAHISKDGRSITIRIPVSFRQRAGRKQIVTPAGETPWAPAPRLDPALLKAVVRAHRWREMLENGDYASVAELAKAENVNDSYVSRILRLTLLAPDIIEAIASGQQPATMQVGDLLRPAPIDWQTQRQSLLN